MWDFGVKITHSFIMSLHSYGYVFVLRFCLKSSDRVAGWIYIYMDAVFDLFLYLILLIQYVWIHVSTWYQPL